MSDFADLFIAAQQDTVKGRDSEILDYRYGFTGHEAHTLEEIGGIYTISRERVRQLVNRAQKRILSKANREEKKGETEKPCVLLKSYIHKKVYTEGENTIEESIANLVREDLEFLPTHLAASLVTFLPLRDYLKITEKSV